MTQITQRRFTSLNDFFSRLGDVFRGPTLVMTFHRLDHGLRERIMLAVSVANNCRS